MQTGLQTDSDFGGIMDAGTRLLPAASGEGARKEMALHHLPCVIDHAGPANVSSYFVISEDKTTSLRGRQLKGVDRSAPEGWEGAQEDQPRNRYADRVMLGVVWEKKASKQGDVCVPVGSFQKYTEWGHDVEPDGTAYGNLVDWLALQATVRSCCIIAHILY